jgi:hypothetical protein
MPIEHGAIKQIAYVVDDLDEASARWALVHTGRARCGRTMTALTAAKLGAVGALACLQLGCGLILQGPSQRVRVSSQPQGANIEAQTRHGMRGGTAPLEVAVSRRRPHIAVVRANKEGYRSACRIIRTMSAPLLVALDSIPAAIPMAIEAIAGTWPGLYPPDVQVPLEELPDGYADVLPPAQVILDALQQVGLDFCDPSPQLKTWMEIRSKYTHRAAQVVVSAGELSRPYDIVGRVDVNASGVDYFVWSFWQVGGFGSFHFQRYEHKEDPAAVNEMLKFRAFELYGDTFDAIVNVHYEDMPSNAVAAGGVAVRFTAARQAAGQPSREERLREIQTLLDRGLITRDEFNRKRAAILDEL